MDVLDASMIFGMKPCCPCSEFETYTHGSCGRALRGLTQVCLSIYCRVLSQQVTSKSCSWKHAVGLATVRTGSCSCS